MPAKGYHKTTCKHGHARTPDNVSAGSSCKVCKVARSKAYRKTPEGKAARAKQQRAWAKRNPASVKNTQQKIRYGITKAAQEAQIKEQGNRCAVCRIEFDEAHPPKTDHCHMTKRVRGQLCGTCNTGLGMFHENVETLSNAIQYLSKFKEAQ